MPTSKPGERHKPVSVGMEFDAWRSLSAANRVAVGESCRLSRALMLSYQAEDDLGTVIGQEVSHGIEPAVVKNATIWRNGVLEGRESRVKGPGPESWPSTLDPGPSTLLPTLRDIFS